MINPHTSSHTVLLVSASAGGGGGRRGGGGGRRGGIGGVQMTPLGHCHNNRSRLPRLPPICHSVIPLNPAAPRLPLLSLLPLISSPAATPSTGEHQQGLIHPSCLQLIPDFYLYATSVMLLIKSSSLFLWKTSA